jgi:hypothetical protein
MKLGNPKSIQRLALLSKLNPDVDMSEAMQSEPYLSTWVQMRKIATSYARARERIKNEKD